MLRVGLEASPWPGALLALALPWPRKNLVGLGLALASKVEALTTSLSITQKKNKQCKSMLISPNQGRSQPGTRGAKPPLKKNRSPS